MKSLRLSRAAAVAAVVLSLPVLASRSLVFATQNHASPQVGPPPQNQPGPPPGPSYEMPVPTNLKVLPRNLTAEQVHEIMEQWEGELGTKCQTCHAVDRKNLGPDGRPRLNFADDSKEEKRTARKMYKMVADINFNYISKIDNSGAPVTCGTCHRGHLGPEPFAAPEHADDH